MTIAFFGDGATSSNDFHAGLNFAGVFRCPSIFFCQNNQWAIFMPRKRRTMSATLAEKAEAYGDSPAFSWTGTTSAPSIGRSEKRGRGPWRAPVRRR